jgi:hypothetical protein
MFGHKEITRWFLHRDPTTLVPNDVRKPAIQDQIRNNCHCSNISNQVLINGIGAVTEVEGQTKDNNIPSEVTKRKVKPWTHALWRISKDEDLNISNEDTQTFSSEDTKGLSQQ